METDDLRQTSGLPYDPDQFKIPASKEFKRKCRNLARRKHTRSWHVGFSPCGQFSVWQGIMHGNLWALTERDVDRRLGL